MFIDLWLRAWHLKVFRSLSPVVFTLTVQYFSCVPEEEIWAVNCRGLTASGYQLAFKNLSLPRWFRSCLDRLSDVFFSKPLELYDILGGISKMQDHFMMNICYVPVTS